MNVKVFILITSLNESKALIKYVLCDCGCTRDCKKSNLDQNCNKKC